jgi:lysyl-tRNA synthetase class 1
MTKYIEKALEQTAKIKGVFEELSNRQLDDNWTPVLFLGEDNKFEKGDLSTWDRDAKTLNGRSYKNGGAKLDWRLDWPARWAELRVNVEPFGAQEHGAAGGSYDTGKVFAQEVFGVEAPYDAARYGHIHRPGENVKMSSSKGNVVTPEEALNIMPAEILRYFIVRSRPEKKIIFDPGVGLYNLVDEFAAAQEDPDHEFRDAYNFAVAGDVKLVISRVPFKHLIQVYQAARQNEEEALEILARTDHQQAVEDQREIIISEFKFVHNWLQKYAPNEVKFEVQEKLPEHVELSENQRAFLTDLAFHIESRNGQEIDGQAMHELIYAAKDNSDLTPKEAFQALYRVILGKDYGPKAGWFLSSLDREWLIRRLHLQA